MSKVEKRKVLTREKGTGDAIDNILTNKLLGIPIFAVVMFLVFQISQVWVGPLIADTLVAWIETFQGFVADSLADANPLLTALLADGIIGGVGAVVGFLPLVMIMYFSSPYWKTAAICPVSPWCWTPFSRKWVFPANP